MRLYYIINIEYSSEFATFWLPDARGYTLDQRKAGLFDKAYCDQRQHNKALVFVPVDEIGPADTVQAVRLSVIRSKAIEI